MTKRTPFERVFGAASVLALAGLARATPKRIEDLLIAVDAHDDHVAALDRNDELSDYSRDLGDAGLSLIVVANAIHEFGLTTKGHEQLCHVVENYVAARVGQATPGTPEADPAFWWREGAMA